MALVCAAMAVAGDYAESPAEPQLLLQQAAYFVVPVLPVLPVPGVVGAGVGVVVLPLMLPDVPLPVLAPAPAPVRASRRQFSRCAPTRSRHFASAAGSREPELVAPPVALRSLEPGAPAPPAALPPAAPPTPAPDDEPLAPVPPDEPED